MDCSNIFKYLDLSVHTIVDGPDPRDHLANERNLLTWVRTGTTLALVENYHRFMTLLDMPTKNFAPSYSLPWTSEPVSLNAKIKPKTDCETIALGWSRMAGLSCSYHHHVICRIYYGYGSN
ncbi:hypothetical protein MFLAVUS_005491 [Mucor flavus]|uniref:DUF202 domain-containing protein n=1 Tax=Mucor flavus TaxID=439312 RepID=A0ABP9YYX3_9FUNG